MADQTTFSTDHPAFVSMPADRRIYFQPPSYVPLKLKSDGTYELGGTVADMLADECGVVCAFGAALRDQYEAGRRGEPPPTAGRPWVGHPRETVA
ncbi:hypothetical protein MRF4_17175 [Methylobacterium radiotolerans]|uniref:hypothetical protein n=1 Tax=Methylobacterium TaxID=407 RepID=UPI002F333C88